jgi:hypothetical protein
VESSGKSKLGLLAGHGQLPAMVARAAAGLGYEVHAFGFEGMLSPELSAAAASVSAEPFCRLGALIGRIESAGVRRAVTIGSIAQTSVIGGAPQFDDLALELWRRLPDRRVDSIMRAIVAEFCRRGIEILELPPFLPGLLAPPGRLTRRAPDAKEWEDIRFGFGLAKAMGGMDIGQTVVVKHRAVLAVEAVEGTDRAIARGGELARGGAVVVKVAKPDQDLRFDLPAVGLETLESMRAAGAEVLAVEAGMVLMVEREAMVRAADEAGIAIVGVLPAEVRDER